MHKIKRKHGKVKSRMHTFVVIKKCTSVCYLYRMFNKYFKVLFRYGFKIIIKKAMENYDSPLTGFDLD